jgi:CspA family cold shock protein
MEGKVKWYDIRKGYGFVEGDDGQDYFVHYTSVNEGVRLRENDRVSFDQSEGEKGKQAQNVVLLQKGSEIANDEKPEEAPAEEVTEEEPTEESTEEETKEEEAPAEEESTEEEKEK